MYGLCRWPRYVPSVCVRERERERERGERERVHVWLVQMAEVCTICILCLPLYVHLYPGLFLSIHLSLRYNLCAVKGLLCVDVMNQTINE